LGVEAVLQAAEAEPEARRGEGVAVVSESTDLIDEPDRRPPASPSSSTGGRDV